MFTDAEIYYTTTSHCKSAAIWDSFGHKRVKRPQRSLFSWWASLYKQQDLLEYCKFHEASEEEIVFFVFHLRKWYKLDKTAYIQWIVPVFTLSLHHKHFIIVIRLHHFSFLQTSGPIAHSIAIGQKLRPWKICRVF